MIQSAVNAVNTARPNAGGKASTQPNATQAPTNSNQSGYTPAAPTSAPNAGKAPANSMGSAAKVAEKLGTAPPKQTKAPQAEPAKAQTTEAQAEAVAEAIRKMKFKMNGRDVELPESEVIALAQMGGSARERWEEAAKLRKQADSLWEAIKNPKSLIPTLKQAGYTDQQIREISSQVIAQQIDEEMLSPQEKRIRELEAREAQREAEQKHSEEQRKQHELQQMTQYWQSTYDKEITAALQKHKMPGDAYLIKKMCAIMQDAIENKIPASWDDVISLVKPEVFSHHRFMIENYEPDVLNEAVSEAVLKKLREADLKKLKNPSAPPPATKQRANVPQSKAPRGLSKDDWKARMDRIKRGEE